MKQYGESRKRKEIKHMFDRLSGHYDVLNRMITFGFDSGWRRRVILKADLSPGKRLLDVGSGTGDMVFAALRKEPLVRATAVDFSFAMIKKGRSRPGGDKIPWCSGDALQLPFSDNTFDAVTSGYLIRNVLDPLKAFQEQLRVLKPGGVVVCLETSPPKQNLVRPLILVHLKLIIPLLGRLVGGNQSAYTYLPNTTRGFMKPHEMVATMQKSGFESISCQMLMFGTMTIHSGRRPKRS